MFKRMRITAFMLVASLCFAFLVPDPIAVVSGHSVLGPAPASAQEKRKRRSLFNVIFGRSKSRKKAVKTRKRKRRVKKRTRRKTAVRRQRAKVQKSAPVVQKAEDAKTILVVGDFFAGGLADGLERLLADSPGLVVVDKSRGLSGLVRNDIVSWPERVAELTGEVKPDYVVAMVGANDRQQFRLGKKRIKRRTDEWKSTYKARVDSVGAALKATGLPYSWVGLPPMGQSRMNGDFLYFNELYGAAAASENGKFVDVWDGFSDSDGNYSRSGPDVSGQIVLLRSKDGINLTRAGRMRLAFYVQSEIKRALSGDGAETVPIVALEAGKSEPSSPVYDPAATGRTVVVRLNDPAADGAEVLAGEKIDRAISILPKPTVTQKRVDVSGSTQRADNFRWPPQVGGEPVTETSVAGSPTQ